MLQKPGKQWFKQFLDLQYLIAAIQPIMSNSTINLEYAEFGMTCGLHLLQSISSATNLDKDLASQAIASVKTVLHSLSHCKQPVMSAIVELENLKSCLTLQDGQKRGKASAGKLKSKYDREAWKQTERIMVESLVSVSKNAGLTTNQWVLYIMPCCINVDTQSTKAICNFLVSMLRLWCLSGRSTN